jgi:hypothetical protein
LTSAIEGLEKSLSCGGCGLQLHGQAGPPARKYAVDGDNRNHRRQAMTSRPETWSLSVHAPSAQIA